MAKRNNQVAKIPKNRNLVNVKFINNTNKKFKNKNKEESKFAKKKFPKKAKDLKSQEERIEELEKENELFYQDKFEGTVEVNEDDWNANSDYHNSDSIFNNMNQVEEKKFDPRIVETYTVLGDVLHNYTSGKLPKAFNILPVTENWDDIIPLTNPMNWSPQAYFEATKMFCSNLNASLAEKFYSKFLLPRVRLDIKLNNKLNIHFYNSLKKAIFKPSGFFKGIILPLSDSTTAKEAAIFGSIIKKCSIPVAHSSAAIMKLLSKCSNKISMGALFFVKMLLLKKYALPCSVKEDLVKFFVKFSDCSNSDVPTKLPVLWHQTLLVFVQIYKLDLTSDEKSLLLSLIEKKNHHLITEEIFRELNYKPPVIIFGNEKMNLDN